MRKILILLALFVPGQLLAAEFDGKVDPDTIAEISVIGQSSLHSLPVKENPDTIEEISVIGQRSLLSLHIEVFKLEENFYALFNELNTENEFDVTCHKEFRFMSHVKGRACKAVFERKATAREARQSLKQISGPSTAGEISRKQEQLYARMTKLVEESPNLLAALLELDTARKKYEAARKERFKHSWIVF